eukprot:TRINITY_DN2743_c0_g1_i1.p1 TRINITY_DN2743_c0_g1~~TRINITY_DN2743_c0_g1_i1.p1  ORF type:complete len:194 (+),score=23.41 TRINITY_DN2743_c0_g1_i1:205-786(+)
MVPSPSLQVDMSPTPFTGQCFCGAVKLTVTAEKPIFCGFCHCVECRRFHSAAVYQVFYTRPDEMKIEGEEFLTHYTQRNYVSGRPTELGCDRTFCSICGSRVTNVADVPLENVKAAHPGEESAESEVGSKMSIVGTFPSLFDKVPDAFRAQLHAHCAERVIVLPEDGLVKYTKFLGVPGNEVLPGTGVDERMS